MDKQRKSFMDGQEYWLGCVSGGWNSQKGDRTGER